MSLVIVFGDAWRPTSPGHCKSKLMMGARKVADEFEEDPSGVLHMRSKTGIDSFIDF